MNEAEIERFAATLAAVRQTGDLVETVPALALDEGYRVAAALAVLIGPVLGWKIGATSPAAMAFLGVDSPIYGRLFHLWDGERTVALAGARSAEIEPEILIRLGDDLMPAAIHAGAELNRPSYAAPFAHGPGAIVADNAASCGVLIGPALPLAALDDAAGLRVAITINGAPGPVGTADAVLGSPLVALEALRRALAGDARGLRAGDWIATGAMARAVPVAHGDRVVIDAGSYGAATALIG
jgi:2-keto-4-pentenoate hydratase